MHGDAARNTLLLQIIRVVTIQRKDSWARMDSGDSRKCRGSEMSSDGRVGSPRQRGDCQGQPSTEQRDRHVLRGRGHRTWGDAVLIQTEKES